MEAATMEEEEKGEKEEDLCFESKSFLLLLLLLFIFFFFDSSVLISVELLSLFSFSFWFLLNFAHVEIFDEISLITWQGFPGGNSRETTRNKQTQEADF